MEVTNFGRFYTAIRALNPIGVRDEVKQSIVYQYTDGRTCSLHQMTREEYNRCCEDLERKTGQNEELRRERSATLKLMQKMGVDTTDWGRVNHLCENPRIMGKVFYLISAEEHRELRRKLHCIKQKGGFGMGRKAQSTDTKPKNTSITIVIPSGSHLGQA